MRKLVRFIIDEVLKQLVELDEATTTGSVAGYLTPNAFRKKGDKHPLKKYLEKRGYEFVNENRWLELKKDDTRNNNKKIADGIKNMRRQLDEMENYLRWYNRLKKESDINAAALYKRTPMHLEKIKHQIERIQQKMDELIADEKT
jgi:hypothetical protein